GIEPAGLAEVLGAADVLSVHLPLTAETSNLLDGPALQRLRPGAIVVSVGRGEVVDEAALAGALRSGQVGGAGLDVRAAEPPPPGSGPAPRRRPRRRSCSPTSGACTRTACCGCRSTCSGSPRAAATRPLGCALSPIPGRWSPTTARTGSATGSCGRRRRRQRE